VKGVDGYLGRYYDSYAEFLKEEIGKIGIQSLRQFLNLYLELQPNLKKLARNQMVKRIMTQVDLKQSTAYEYVKALRALKLVNYYFFEILKTDQGRQGLTEKEMKYSHEETPDSKVSANLGKLHPICSEQTEKQEDGERKFSTESRDMSSKELAYNQLKTPTVRYKRARVKSRDETGRLTEKQRRFREFVDNLKKKRIRGKEYRDAVSKWFRENKRKEN